MLTRVSICVLSFFYWQIGRTQKVEIGITTTQQHLLKSLFWCELNWSQVGCRLKAMPAGTSRWREDDDGPLARCVPLNMRRQASAAQMVHFLFSFFSPVILFFFQRTLRGIREDNILCRDGFFLKSSLSDDRDIIIALITNLPRVAKVKLFFSRF